MFCRLVQDEDFMSSLQRSPNYVDKKSNSVAVAVYKDNFLEVEI